MMLCLQPRLSDSAQVRAIRLWTESSSSGEIVLLHSEPKQSLYACKSMMLRQEPAPLYLTWASHPPQRLHPDPTIPLA